MARSAARDWIRVAHRRGVPCLNDAAADVPPISNRSTQINPKVRRSLIGQRAPVTNTKSSVGSARQVRRCGQKKRPARKLFRLACVGYLGLLPEQTVSSQPIEQLATHGLEVGRSVFCRSCRNVCRARFQRSIQVPRTANQFPSRAFSRYWADHYSCSPTFNFSTDLTLV